MLRVNQLAGFGASLAGGSAIAIVRALGLTDGLKLCLDAGDAASYASGQSWLDLSGNGHDFFRGADGSATASDATFNGIPGALSANEYWSFDGGDYFTYDSANEAWMNAIHKDNAKFTLAFWAYLASNSVVSMFAGNNLAAPGFNYNVRATGVVRFTVTNGPQYDTVAIAPAGRWSFFAFSMDEAAPAAFHQINQTVETFASAYTTPSASNAGNTFQIGARGGAENFPNGNRLAMAMAWEGVALSHAQVMAFYRATRGRFGV